MMKTNIILTAKMILTVTITAKTILVVANRENDSGSNNSDDDVDNMQQ